ncbi:MAG: DNA-directed RNA polymerase subunit omega [Clostridiales bacterium]|jgi:DNA-directed RNA polymerase omega subunit|nr:DNA-directed RNA polymerase subunit omega [Clostridiales bacterium]
MLTDPSIEKLKAKSASPYDLAVLVSKRARELTDGAQPMVDDTDAANVVSLACREVAADKIVAVEGDVSSEAVIPITREERIRRIEEERTRQRLLEEERLERSGIDLTQDISDKGMDNLFNAINGGEEEEESEGEYVEEDEFADEDEKQED